MICEFCGGEIAKREVRKQHRLHNKLYLIEKVEAEVYNERGERYFHAKALNAIDRLLEGKHEVKETLRVEVVSL